MATTQMRDDHSWLASLLSIDKRDIFLAYYI